MKPQIRANRIVIALGALALGIVVAGCIVLPQWTLPARPLYHNSSTIDLGALDDGSPDAVIYNGTRYVVFAGEEAAGSDFELYLQSFTVNGLAGTLSNTPVRLTNNSNNDLAPQITSDGVGNLYIVWEYEYAVGDHDIYWLKVQASDLALLDGPNAVATSFDNETGPQIEVNTSHSLVVWASTNPTSTVYYNQIVNSTGAVLTATTASQGTGCASTLYHQRTPRLTRSAGGGYAEVVWEGETDAVGGDAIFWREISTSSGTPSSDCIVLSNAVGAGGDDSDPQVSINGNNRSFVSWTRDDGTSFDIIMRSIDFSYNICGYYRPNDDAPADDYNSAIAAGHVISDWAHLVWERTGTANGIMYELLDTSDCSSDTAPVIQVSGIYSVSTNPVPTGNDVDSPQIAVRSNAVIAMPLAVGAATPAQIKRLATSGRISQTEADAVLKDGVVSADEINQLLNQWLAAQALRRAAQIAESENVTGEDQGSPTHAGQQPDCVANPADEKCIWASQQLQAPVIPAAPTSFPGCGTNAADAIGISFIDDAASRLYAAYFQAAEVLDSGTCYVDAWFDGQTTQLTRDYQGLYDYDVHQILLDDRGLASVVWLGRAPQSGSLVIFPENDEVFFAVTQYPLLLPLIRR